MSTSALKQRVESSSFEDVGDETLETDLYDAATLVFSARFSQSAGVSGCECSHRTGSPFMLAVKPNTFRSDFLRPPPPSTDVPTALCEAFSAAPATCLALRLSLTGEKLAW